MPLMTGNQPAQQQAQEQVMSDGDIRQAKTADLVIKLRRYWRLFVIAWYFLAGIYGTVTGLWNGANLGFLFVHYWIGGAIGAFGIYLIVTYVFLYLLVGKTAKVVFYLKDLFGGSKQTRL